MTQRNDGGPAYPVPEPFHLEPRNVDEMKRLASGMSLCDYFAAKAMQGMLSDLPKTLYGADWKERLAKSAYDIADAMLAARERTNG